MSMEEKEKIKQKAENKKKIRGRETRIEEDVTRISLGCRSQVDKSHEKLLSTRRRLVKEEILDKRKS